MVKWTQKVWRYRLDNPVEIRSEHLVGVEFANEWITISNGSIRIKEGYAWDGCSPTWLVPGIKWWVGVPDGLTNPKSGHCWAYYATLVHDAMCQFRAQIPIDKVSVVALFHHMLQEGGFPRPIANLYATVVYWLGPQDWPGLTFPAVQLRSAKAV